MANLITVARLILLFVVIWMIYVGSVQVIEACMLLIIVVFASDGLDGWVARKRGSTSAFGAVFDIAGDRIVAHICRPGPDPGLGTIDGHHPWIPGGRPAIALVCGGDDRVRRQ
jgi:hypothetical protein